MRKEYEQPSVDIVECDMFDIITTSEIKPGDSLSVYGEDYIKIIIEKLP